MGNDDPSSFDKSAFDFRQFGRMFEDFHVGQTFEHRRGRTMESADSVTFCAATCNWSPLYLDKSFATANGHPERPINPALVASVVIGLTVEDLSEIAGPFLGMESCVFERSVYPGDTLTATSKVLECRLSKSRVGSGVVTWQTVGLNQRGETVLTLVRSNLVKNRVAEPSVTGLTTVSKAST